MGEHKTGKFCPIDGTEIINHIDYEINDYECLTCGADYKRAISNDKSFNDEQYILEAAKEHLKYLPRRIEIEKEVYEDQKRDLERQRRGIEKLEKILEIAKEKGLLEKVNP